MPAVVLLSAVRTPYGRLLGSLSAIPAAQLGAAALAEALRRAGVRLHQVDRVLLGNTSAHALRGNPAAAVAAAAGDGAPPGGPAIPAATVRAGCASGTLAILWAVEAIRSGACRAAVAGGFESASTAPHLVTGLRRGLRLGAGRLLDAARHDGPTASPVGSEADVEAFLRAHNEGAFSDEIVAVEGPPGKQGTPVLVRDDDAVATLADGKGGAGGDSPLPPLADAAAALVLASATWAEERGLRPAGRVAPALDADRASGFDRIEADLSEEAAARLMGSLPAGRRARVNADGGRALLGHAAGADGAALAVRLAHALRRAGGGRGLALASGGWGEAAGLIIEV